MNRRRVLSVLPQGVVGLTTDVFGSRVKLSANRLNSALSAQGTRGVPLVYHELT